MLRSTRGTTLYLGADIEIAPDGTYTKYVHQDALITGSGGTAVITWLHRDHLTAIRMTTDALGTVAERSNDLPYGERLTAITPAKGFIGERHDPASTR